MEEKVTNLGTKKPFQVWTVNGRDYKLKLVTSNIAELEQRYNKSIISLFTEGMPPLSIMLDIIHVSLQKFEHGIDRKTVNDIFDDYLDNGGNIQDFYTDIFLGVALVSGFFTEKLMQTILRDVQEMKS